jgi:dihydroneopterin aldolase / 2-amino-4-hydroxy-6-hydroxymethyldihydropteridine diphosphokinase
MLLSGDDTMDKIIIEDLEIYGFHGVYSEEKKIGQRFLITVELFTSTREAGISDDLTKTINYGQLCYEIEEEFMKHKHDLIEKAAEDLASVILLKYPDVKKIKLLLKKPWAPIGKPVKYAAVEIERSRHEAYIAIGSNMGDKRKNIDEAIDKINKSKFSKVLDISKFYTTEPVGYTEQDEFLNCAIKIDTLLYPDELMKLLLKIEKELKRERIVKWGPRTIDLDIILFDDIICSKEETIIPHPRMHERMFVIEPMCDIAPYVIHPILKKRMIELKSELEK